MIFSDLAIKALIAEDLFRISPFAEENIRPASICLLLGEELIIHAPPQGPIDLIDTTTFPTANNYRISDTQTYTLLPKQFILGITKERIGLSKSISGHISNISGLARLGLTVALSTHVCPGFGEKNPRPLTLEIINHCEFPIILRAGLRICHLLLSPTEPTSLNGYDEMFPGKYTSTGAGLSEYAAQEFQVRG